MGSFGRVLKWFLEPYGKGVGLGRLATLNIHSIFKSYAIYLFLCLPLLSQSFIPIIHMDPQNRLKCPNCWFKHLCLTKGGG